MWQRAGLYFISWGIVLIFLMIFPSLTPGADSTVGPIQLLILMSGIALVVAGVDIYRSVSETHSLSKYLRQYKIAYGLWLGGPILYYLTYRFSAFLPVHGKEILLLNWISVFLTTSGIFSFVKLKLLNRNCKTLLSDFTKRVSLHFPNIATCMFYGIYGIALLSPLAANSVLPQAPDFANHTAIIVQAKSALDEEQFPLFVAPWQFSGWRYPLFQFYSPLPYTLAALIYKWIVPENPYLAFKLLLWLSLAVSGIFINKSAFWLTRSRISAFLSGVVYMTTPYFMMNINARGALTEAVAQGILPISLYFSLRATISPKLRYVFLSAITWFALATTHTITFIYFALFVGIFFLFIGIRRRIRLIRYSIALLLGCVLGLYFLVPVVSANYLSVNSWINKNNPYKYNWLTHIESLLSPTSVSPMPKPWPIGGPPNLNPAVGWPILLAVGTLGYYSYSRTSLSYKVGTHRLVSPLLLLFGLVFFMTWSPVDFWKYLPIQFWVIQFPYRLLAQLAWIGSMLFAYAFAMMFGAHFNIRTAVIGLLLIQVSLNSYLPTPPSSDVELSEIVRSPDMGYGKGAYLISPETYPFATSSRSIELPTTFTDGWLRLNYEMRSPFQPPVISSSSVLHLEGSVSQELTNGTTLSIFINGSELAQKKLEPGSFVWDINLRKIIPDDDSFSLEFRADKTFSTPSDQRLLAILVRSIVLQNFDSRVNSLLLADTQSDCTQRGITTSCSVIVPQDVQFVQIPVLYYPGLLDVRVDGTQTPYFPFIHQQYLLVGIRLNPGTHSIDVQFRGVTWARWGSSLAWLGIVMALVLDQLLVLKFYKLIWRSGLKRQEQP